MNREITYVLVTAARNEEAYIEKTIQSVITQTILPKKWVIVSDDSADRTDEIVKRYDANSDFIQLLPRRSDNNRNFASKVYAIRAGIERLNNIEYDFIGNLDADVSFGPNYYKCVLTKFQENPKLGITGGVLFDAFGGKWVRQHISSSWSVSGPIQMFRRKCYEDIGGYRPLQIGGVDGVAEVMARMYGWEVKSFDDIRVLHHRRTGTEKGNILFARFRDGIKEHYYGSHPLFEIAKCISRIKVRPYFVGSLLRFSGYIWAYLRRDQLDVPNDVVKFLRREQIQRLYKIFSKKINESE